MCYSAYWGIDLEPSEIEILVSQANDSLPEIRLAFKTIDPKHVGWVVQEGELLME
jgi:hypothetical protein